MKKVFSLLSLLCIAVLSFSVNVNAQVGDGVSIEIDDLKKVDKSKNEYNFSFDTDNNRYVVIKQSNIAIIWTEKEIAVDDQREFTSDFRNLAAKKDKSLLKAIDKSAVYYIFGEGQFDMRKEAKTLGVYNFIIDGQNVILKTNADKISHADYGTYTNENENKPDTLEYIWKEIGVTKTDSATGFLEGFNYNVNPKANNWFQAQELNFEDKNEINLNIQAGNFKNKTNFVGTITLTKTDNKVTMNYKVLDSLTLPDTSGYKLGDKVTVVNLDGFKYLASLEKLQISNNGKDLIKSENGNSFEIADDKFNFYAHFDCKYIEYELVEKE